MSSRAILRSGAGHKYWNDFSQETQCEIERLAKEINENLFTPELKNPVKTLDLPLAGKGYSSRSLPLIFDLVKLANNVSTKKVDEDLSGEETVSYLKNTLKIVRRFTTTHPSSLGLHPAVYFYSEKGRYQPTAFMAWIELIKDFDSNKSFDSFIKIRAYFEKSLVAYKYLTNQVTVKYGSGLKGYKQLKEVSEVLIELVSDGNSIPEIGVKMKEKFLYLNMDYKGDVAKSADFNQNTKSEVFLNSALSEAAKCEICKGYIHTNSITIDHIDRKEDGGIGVAENGQIAHPYCNSTYKN